MDFKLELVVVPVSDVDLAKTFYGERCGFVVDVDQSVGDAFLQLCVADIDAARAELAGRGVDISPVRHVEGGEWLEGHGGPWNSFAFFSDPDGNGWALQEKPEG